MSRETMARQAFDRLRDEVEPAGVSAYRELLRPNCHLTAPCYRDFSKYVQSHAGWTIRRRTATEAEKRASGETRLGRCYFINVTYHPPAGPVQVGHEQQQQAAKRKAYGQDMSAPSTRNVRPRGGSGGVSAGFLDACRGVHWVSGEGGCNNEACRGQAKCVSSCRGCPDAVPLLDACQGNHFVDGGCENDACRGRKKCIASCRGCPNRPENRRGGCTVM